MSICLELLLPQLPHHDGMHPGPMRQNKLYLAEVALGGKFDHINRKRDCYNYSSTLATTFSTQ